MMIGNPQHLPMKVLFNYLEILFDVGQEHQKKKRREFQRIGKRFMLGVPSVIEGKLVFIYSKILLIVIIISKYWKRT